MTAIERLEELLNERDSTIDDLRRRVEEMEEQKNDLAWRWARHEIVSDDLALPVPRLEIRCDSPGEYSHSCLYSMVYRHLLGHIIRVPLGQTVMNGSYARGVTDLAWHMPYREGAHIKSDAVQFGLPAFVVMDGKIQEIAVQP